MDEAKKGSWIVTMRCVVVKEVVVEDCTEEQAKADPWGYAVDENETHQEDWEVRRVEPNGSPSLPSEANP